MLAPDPAYAQFVDDAGITGNDDFNIVGNFCCGEGHQPCTNFPIVSVSHALSSCRQGSLPLCADGTMCGQGVYAPESTFSDMSGVDNT
jgi:hypothetical protein